MGHDLDDDELKVTRRSNGVDDIIKVSVKEIDDKVKELESTLYDQTYCEGLRDALIAVKHNRIKNL